MNLTKHFSRGWPVSRPAWERLPPGTGLGKRPVAQGGTTEWARAVRGKGRLIFLYSPIGTGVPGPLGVRQSSHRPE
jgi:hypothetical protein